MKTLVAREWPGEVIYSLLGKVRSIKAMKDLVNPLVATQLENMIIHHGSCRVGAGGNSRNAWMS